MIQFHLVAFAKIEKPELQERKITNIKVEDTIKETREVDFEKWECINQIFIISIF